MYTSTSNRRLVLRVLALALVIVLAFAAVGPAASAVTLTHGDLLRYIPIGITVDSEKVVVYGYFTNLNPNCSVSSFRDFSMDVYMDNYLIATGYFGTLDSFTIEPLDVRYHTFVFPGRNNLNPGAYVCEDDDFAIMSCTFDYSELVYNAGVK